MSQRQKPHEDKFEPLSSKCLFLGYAATQKAYRLYGITSRVVQVSRVVIFYEHIYPYKNEDATSNKEDHNIPTYLPTTTANSHGISFERSPT